MVWPSRRSRSSRSRAGAIAGEAQRAAGLSAEEGEELDVVVAEVAVPLVEQLQHAEDLALRLDGRGAERARAVAVARRQLAGHRALPLGVVDDARDAVLRHLAGDACAQWQAGGEERRARAAERGLEVELAGVLVEQERRARLGARELEGAREGDVEQLGGAGDLRELALDGVEEIELADLAPLGREEARVLEGDRDLRRHRRQRLLVFGVEGLAVGPVQDLHRAQHLAGLAEDGSAEDRAGAEAGEAVELGMEARVGVGVGDVGGVAGRDHVAGDALSERKADFAQAAALQHLRPDLAAAPVDEVERGAFGGQELRHVAHHHVEQGIDFHRAADRQSDLQQRVTPPVPHRRSLEESAWQSERSTAPAAVRCAPRSARSTPG